MVHPRQKGTERTQNRDEATEQHGAITVALKEAFCTFKVTRIEVKHTAIAVEECSPTGTSKFIPKTITDDRSECGCKDHPHTDKRPVPV